MTATTTPAVLACPQCRGPVALGDEIRCDRCGRVGRRVADGFVDFTRNADEAAVRIIGWPEDFVRALLGWALQCAAGNADVALAEPLRQHGLVGADGSLTPLGHNVRYHLDEYRWQKGRKGLDGVLELAAIGPSVRVLDVGCGAAQTLRRLEPDRPVELFGVDTDAAALALGVRLGQLEGIDLTLAAGSATALPYRDGAFDLVVTRVALNYVHQRTALREMVRVLRPGGYLFCRVERIWHDLRAMHAGRGVKGLVCGLRDLGWGALHALTGWQPSPGKTWSGGRAFASAGRIRSTLTPLGCRVVRAVESPNGPTLWGRRTQLIVVAQKEE